MPGTPEALYDAHAARLHAYCWSLVGEDADAAVRDTFVAAMRHPPRGDAVLWLYALARSACLDRGAPDRPFVPGTHPDPLLRAAAGLRADHREVLVLSAGEWLDEPDIALVLGVATDTARQLLQAARTRLERAVLDRLMREPGSPYHSEIITAFEKGTLPRLLARRAPDRPPAALREQVLAACAAEIEQPLSTLAFPSPLVAIGPATTRPAASRRRSRGLGTVAGLAASAAAAVGLIAAWAGAKDGGERLTALNPSAGYGSESATAGPVTSPDLASSDPAGTAGTGPAGADPKTSASSPYGLTPPVPGVQPADPGTPAPDPDEASPTPDPSSPLPTPDPRTPTPPPSPEPDDPTSPAPDEGEGEDDKDKDEGGPLRLPIPTLPLPSGTSSQAPGPMPAPTANPSPRP
ncbi:DNA-directed RNA polymerase specialized sigma subunit, sigma24 family [Thermomonospora echinospora]|uniref:DNA-directed RNA polymerase specialized sigma subunit, sigma24 family n=1 Tax=Thermomonospora echinospora TaxID=1992 RepID=A0A1H5V1M6_9ACTN|nr:RNA polymerase sigma factor [Thermomonospora echinospora]SEF81136.1 DNA-directed RNA polymerase specialized sigma subunit, sigma24 family [Thermomonospora echinospora]